MSGIHKAILEAEAKVEKLLSPTLAEPVVTSGDLAGGEVPLALPDAVDGFAMSETKSVCLATGNCSSTSLWRDPSLSFAATNMADYYATQAQESTDTKEKENFLIEAINAQPNNYERYEALGDFYLEYHHYALAIAAYDAAVRSGITEQAHLGRGKAYFMMGDLKGARSAYTDATLVNSQSVEARTERLEINIMRFQNLAELGDEATQADKDQLAQEKAAINSEILEDSAMLRFLDSSSDSQDFVRLEEELKALHTTTDQENKLQRDEKIGEIEQKALEFLLLGDQRFRYDEDTVAIRSHYNDLAAEAYEILFQWAAFDTDPTVQEMAYLYQGNHYAVLGNMDKAEQAYQAAPGKEASTKLEAIRKEKRSAMNIAALDVWEIFLSDTKWGTDKYQDEKECAFYRQLIAALRKSFKDDPYTSMEGALWNIGETHPDKDVRKIALMHGQVSDGIIVQNLAGHLLDYLGSGYPPSTDKASKLIDMAHEDEKNGFVQASLAVYSFVAETSNDADIIERAEHRFNEAFNEATREKGFLERLKISLVSIVDNMTAEDLALDIVILGGIGKVGTLARGLAKTRYAKKGHAAWKVWAASHAVEAGVGGTGFFLYNTHKELKQGGDLTIGHLLKSYGASLVFMGSLSVIGGAGGALAQRSERELVQWTIGHGAGFTGMTVGGYANIALGLTEGSLFDPTPLAEAMILHPTFAAGGALLHVSAPSRSSAHYRAIKEARQLFGIKGKIDARGVKRAYREFMGKHHSDRVGDKAADHVLLTKAEVLRNILLRDACGVNLNKFENNDANKYIAKPSQAASTSEQQASKVSGELVASAEVSLGAKIEAKQATSESPSLVQRAARAVDNSLGLVPWLARLGARGLVTSAKAYAETAHNNPGTSLSARVAKGFELLFGSKKPTQNRNNAQYDDWGFPEGSVRAERELRSDQKQALAQYLVKEANWGIRDLQNFFGEKWMRENAIENKLDPVSVDEVNLTRTPDTPQSIRDASVEAIERKLVSGLKETMMGTTGIDAVNVEVTRGDQYVMDMYGDPAGTEAFTTVKISLKAKGTEVGTADWQFSSGYYGEGVAFLREIKIDPSMRGKGIARELNQATEAVIGSMGMNDVFVYAQNLDPTVDPRVTPESSGLVHWPKKRGFKWVDTPKDLPLAEQRDWASLTWEGDIWSGVNIQTLFGKWATGSQGWSSDKANSFLKEHGNIPNKYPHEFLVHLGEVAKDGSVPYVRKIASEAVRVPDAPDYAVTLFSKDIYEHFYSGENVTIGASNGSPVFMMSRVDAGQVKNSSQAARMTGMAPSMVETYRNLDDVLSTGEVYGIEFPTEGMPITKPTHQDANGWPHYLKEHGNTAVQLEGANGGLLLNPIAEFVTPGGRPVPPGSILFKLGPNGERIVIREWPLQGDRPATIFMGSEVTPKFYESLKFLLGDSTAVQIKPENLSTKGAEELFARNSRRQVPSFEDFGHISDRHAHHSTSRGDKRAGIYDSNVDIALIQRDTLKNWDRVTLTFDDQGRPSWIFEKKYGFEIGVNSTGKRTSTNQIIMSSDGLIVSAFPVPNSTGKGAKGWVDRKSLSNASQFPQQIVKKSNTQQVYERYDPFIPDNPNALRTHLYLADITPLETVNNRTRSQYYHDKEPPPDRQRFYEVELDTPITTGKGKKKKVRTSILAAEKKFDTPIGVREARGPDGTIEKVPLYWNRTYYFLSSQGIPLTLGGHPIAQPRETHLNVSVWHEKARPVPATANVQN